MNCKANANFSVPNKPSLRVLKLAMLTYFSIAILNSYSSNAYFSIAYANFSMLKQAKALLMLTLALLINQTIETSIIF